MLKSREKKQSVVRLDPDELDRMAAIQSQLGLSKTGVIRRLIRDFNLGSEIINTGSKFIVDGQISTNIFLQLPLNELGHGFIQPSFPGVHYEMWFYQEWLSTASIVGYVICSGIRSLESYEYSLLYLLDGVLCRQDCISGESFGNVGRDCGISQSLDHLQQIFVV